MLAEQTRLGNFNSTVCKQTEDPDQTPHCLHMSHRKGGRLIWDKFAM